MNQNPHPVRPATRRSEAGSAYLMVLMLLVVLTIIGLSLSVITQTEVIIGGSEKQSTRQLYAAGSAVHLASAYELVSRDSTVHDMVLQQRKERMFGDDVTIGDRICTTPYLQVHTAVCNLCMLNQDNEYFAVQNAVTASALRHGGSNLGARHTIGALVAFEPYQRSPVSAQVTSEERLKEPASLDVDPATEVDACEALYIRF
jgi:Tfp pilus assembly protein PilX